MYAEMMLNCIFISSVDGPSKWAGNCDISTNLAVVLQHLHLVCEISRFKENMYNVVHRRTHIEGTCNEIKAGIKFQNLTYST